MTRSPQRNSRIACSVPVALTTVLLLGGCFSSRTDAGIGPAASAAAAIVATVPNGPAKSPSAASGSGESCLVDHSEPVRDTAEAKVTDPASGQIWTHVGPRMDPKATRISLDELQARPEQFVGRLVHVEGKVTAMCGHRRAWFAVANSNASSGDPLRIITAPRFLVPANSIGKLTRAEGVVELRAISKAAAVHIAAEHGLASPPRPVPMLIASSAEFL